MPGKPTYEELEQRIKELESADSERKQVVNALREQVLHHITLMDASLDGIAIIDPSHRVRQANKRFAQMLGYTREEVLGLHTWDWEAKMTEAEIRANFTDFTKTQKTFETRHRRKDGTIFDAEVTVWGAKSGKESMALAITRDITERRRDEEALRESEERYRAFFEQGPDGVVVLEPETARIIEFNDQACRQLGYSREEFARLRVPDIEARETGKETITHIQKVLTEKYDDFETLQRTKQGEIRHIHVTAQLVKIAGRSVYHCIWRDITDHKRVEGALRESEEKYRILIEESTDPIFSLTPDGRYTFANRSFANGVGKSAGDIIGKTIWDVFPREDADKRFAALSQVFDTGMEKVIEVRVPHPDGDQYYVTTITPVKDPAGHVDSVIGSSKNITARKIMEEENEMSMRRFRALMQLNQMAEASLTEITDFTLEEAVSLTGSKIGYLAFLNEDESLLTMHSWSRSAMRECAISDKPIHYPVCGTGLWGEAVRQRKTIITNDYPAPNPFKKGTPAGHVTLLRHMNTPVFDGEKIVIVAGVGNKEAAYTQTDADQISLLMQGMWRLIERKRAEEERERLHDQLTQAQKMEAVGRLAGGVAHDFNNMLSVIIGYTDLAMEQAKPIKPIHTALKEIRKAANRSADVTRQLLAFARKQTISPQVLDLNKIMESMLKMLRRLIGEDIDLIWLPATDLWPVRVDPSQLDQVLVNLCVNARDAIAGVGKIIIETKNVAFDAAYCEDHPYFVPGDFILLAVSDDGCGMDQQTLDNLFEPFFTTKELDKGTGLGLATVYGIVKQNNGFVNVYSELNSGTTFKIYLPRHGIAAAPARKKAATVADEPGNETILVVEDEAPILEMTTMMLERLGYTVLTAQTPGEAIRMAREHAGEIHLLMTDVVMPEMNGRDLARNLLSIYPDIKRLFMSGYTADVIAHHGVLDPGVHFIQKPFSMENMAAKVHEALWDSENDAR